MGARLAMHTAHHSVLTKPLTRARREVGNSSTPAVTAVSPIPCVCAQHQTQALRQLRVRTAPNTSTPSAPYPVCAHSTKHKHSVSPIPKLQALVYDNLPSANTVFSYAMGSRKLSANEQFFVGAQTVSLLPTNLNTNNSLPSSVTGH